MPRDDSTRARSEPAGDKIDWPAELERHGRWLRTVALSRVGDASSADDVMQEVAAAAIEKGHQLRDRSSLAAWLYRLVVMAALQYRRRLGRRRKLIERYVARVPAADTDSRERDPLDWLLAEERGSMVRDALSRLPRRDAELLLLKYSEDWTYQEMATHLGMTASAIEARLHRAREKLRRELRRIDPTLKTINS